MSRLKRLMTTVLSAVIILQTCVPIAYATGTPTKNDATIGESSVQANETAKTEAITSEPIEATDITYQSSDMDTDALFEAYAESVFNDFSIQLFRNELSSKLNADEKAIYDALLTELQKVADGTRTSTEISYTTKTKEFNIIPEEGKPLFVKSGDTYQINEYYKNKVNENIKQAFNVNLTAISNALMNDNPYLFYWMDKGNSVISLGTLPNVKYPDRLNTGLTEIKGIKAQYTYTFQYKVNAKYRGENEYTTNTSETVKTTVSKTNAQNIINGAEGKTDIEKLRHFKNEICKLVSYDKNAADTNTSGTDISPWNLINVFDGNSSTNVVCEGYAKAFKYLCDNSDISGLECRLVTGTGEGGAGAGPHMWNIVTLNGINYMVDVTWCDNDDDSTVSNDNWFMINCDKATCQEGMELVQDALEKNKYVLKGISTDNYHTYDDETINMYGAAVLDLSNKTPEYTITFDANGGTNTSTTAKTVGNKLTSLPTPTQEGFTFTGWYTEQSGGEKVDTTTEFNKNTTIYAQWTKNAKPSVADATITVAGGSYSYNGVAITPKITVTLNGITLTKDTDYTVAYADNKNAGTATITVTGKGKYTGEKTANFTINQLEVALNFENTSFTYDGNEHIPTATATNVASGDTCTVTVTGAKKDAGTYTATATALSNNNYKLPAINTVEFSIAKATAAVTLDESTKTKLYDGKNTATIKYNLKGVNGETAILTFANVALSGKDVGNYPITLDVNNGIFSSANGMLSENYNTITLPSSPTVEIKAKPINIAINAKNTVYNSPIDVIMTSPEIAVGENINDIAEIKCTEKDKAENIIPKNAGTYTATAVLKAGIKNYTLNSVTKKDFSITKLSYGDKKVAALAKYGKNGTADLSGVLCENAKLGTISVTDNDNIIKGTPTLSGNTLNFVFIDNLTYVGKTAKVTIPVTSLNYADYNIIVTLTVADKMDAKITSTQTAYEFVYGEAYDEKTWFTATNTATPAGNWNYTYSSGTKPTDAGTYTVTATYEDNDYKGSKTVNLTITKAPQADFTLSGKPSATKYGDKFKLIANGGTGSGTITWSVTKGSEFAEVDTSGNVTVKGVGEFTITATKKAENNNYTDAVAKITITSAKEDLKGAPTIKGTAKYGETLTADTTNVKGINSEVVTFIYQWKRDNVNIPSATSNTYQITAEDIGKEITVEINNANYNALTTSAVKPIKATAKAIAPTATATYGQTLKDVALTNPEGNTDGIWTWVDSTLTVGDVGTKKFKATFIPTVIMGYDKVENVDITVTVNKAAAPTIIYPTANAITYGQKLSDSALTGGSTQLGTFAWTNSSIVPVVENSGYEVTFTPNAGTLKNYEAITAAKQKVAIKVNKALPAVNAVVTSITGDNNSRTAKIKVTVSKVGVGTAPTGTVTINGVTASLVNGEAVCTLTGLSGNITANALYNGDSNYQNASKEITFDTAKKNQAEFKLNPIGNKTYGDAEITLGTTGGSGKGAVVFTSSDPAVIKIDANKATILKVGTATITAKKLADDDYNEISATETVVVAPKEITPIVVPDTIADIVYTGSEITPVITVKDGETALIKDTDYTVTYADNVNVGTATITISAKGNYNFTAITKNFKITKADQAAFSIKNVPAEIKYGDQAITLETTGGSGTGAVSFTSSDPAVIKLDGNKATILKAGTATITASKAADNNYNAVSCSIDITVNKKPVTIKAQDMSWYENQSKPAPNKEYVTYDGVLEEDLESFKALVKLTTDKDIIKIEVNDSDKYLPTIVNGKFTEIKVAKQEKPQIKQSGESVNTTGMTGTTVILHSDVTVKSEDTEIEKDKIKYVVYNELKTEDNNAVDNNIKNSSLTDEEKNDFISNKNDENVKINRYEISLVNELNNKPVSITSGKVTVFLPYPDGVNSSFKIILKHYKGTALVDVDFNKKDNGITFETDSFSPFIMGCYKPAPTPPTPPTPHIPYDPNFDDNTSNGGFISNIILGFGKHSDTAEKTEREIKKLSNESVVIVKADSDKFRITKKMMNDINEKNIKFIVEYNGNLYEIDRVKFMDICRKASFITIKDYVKKNPEVYDVEIVEVEKIDDIISVVSLKEDNVSEKPDNPENKEEISKKPTEVKPDNSSKPSGNTDKVKPSEKPADKTESSDKSDKTDDKDKSDNSDKSEDNKDDKKDESSSESSKDNKDNSSSDTEQKTEPTQAERPSFNTGFIIAIIVIVIAVIAICILFVLLKKRK